MNAISQTLAPVSFTIETWLRIRDLLLPAIDLLGGTHTETDVVAMILGNQMKLWVLDGAAMVTEFRQYPRLREISVFIAGGNKEQLIRMKPAIEQYGRDNGCHRARVEGRKGWERVHPDYEFLGQSLVKEI